LLPARSQRYARRVRAAIVILGLSACGRIDFDPIAGLVDATSQSGDGAIGTIDAPGIDAQAPDALAAACADAIPVQVGSTSALDTCSGEDLVDGCSSPGTRELVFRFLAPASAGYTFRARTAGTQNISNSTARLDAGCTAANGSCAGILGFGMAAGEVVYLVVEASSGSCASIEFDVIAS
jgi:hypothetical protein